MNDHTIDHTEENGGKAAKILYRPFGLASSIIGGLVAARSSSRSTSGCLLVIARTRPSRCSRSTRCARS
ncbi:hypothetical protein NKG05_15985 [Oerskovia sp. M15]